MHRKKAKRPKSGAEIGRTQKDFSRLTGFSERAIAKWESSDKPDEPVAFGIVELREKSLLRRTLSQTVRFRGGRE
jgi:hypothetical protein